MPEISTPLLQPDGTLAGQRSPSSAPFGPFLARRSAGNLESDVEQSDEQAVRTAAAEGRTVGQSVLMALWLFISFISLTFFTWISIICRPDGIWQLLALPGPCFLLGTIGASWYFCQSCSSRLSTDSAAQIKVIHRLAIATLFLSILYLATTIYLILDITRYIRKYPPTSEAYGLGKLVRCFFAIVLAWMIGYASLCSAVVYKVT